MRLGKIEIVRAATSATPAPARTRGAPGTVNQQGFLLSEEYNRDLRGARALEVWRRMRLSDASVREALWHIFAPILNADADIEPATDDPLDLETAEFARRSFFEWPLRPFRQTLGTVLLYLPQGFQLFELEEQVVEAELAWEDPSTRDQQTAARRQFVTWRLWGHRRPETVWKWNVDAGALVSVTQQVWKDNGYATPEIPGEQLVVFVNEMEGDGFTGLSLLRSAYKPWWMKEVVEKVMAAAFEQHGIGVKTAYVPQRFQDDDAMLDRIEQMLATLAAGESRYMVFPGPYGQVQAQGDGGFMFRIETPPGGMPDFTSALEYLRGEIKGNVLARFSELGHGSVGARSTGDVQSKVWYDALQTVAAYVADVMNEALRRLVLKNYAVDRFPKLVFRGVEAKSLSEFADAHSKLVNAGAIEPDTSYRGAVRQELGMPDEDDDAGQPPAENPDPMVEEE